MNDRYDSSSPDHAHDGIIIPLRNMINEAYALDIAKKIKAQQRQAMKMENMSVRGHPMDI